jgi:hypothetical protein
MFVRGKASDPSKGLEQKRPIGRLSGMSQFALSMLLVIALIGSPGLVGSAKQASAYQLWGYTWPNITNLGICISTSYGNHYNRWLDGIYYWNQTSTDFGYTTGCSTNTVSLLDASYSSVSWDGLAELSVSGTTITAAWGYLNYYYTQNYDVYATNSVAGHEMGHIFGLDHANSDSLMFYTTDRYYTYGIWTPQTDDVNGVNAMY